MLHITLILEDNILLANVPYEGTQWDVQLIDQLTGKTHRTQWNSVQLATIACLAIGYGEEGGNAEPTKRLYAELLLSDAMKDIPKECGIVPLTNRQGEKRRGEIYGYHSNYGSMLLLSCS